MGRELIAQSIVDKAIDLVADGSSLREIARALNLKVTTLHDAITRHPQSLERYERARELQADIEADEIKEIADNEPDASRAKVRVDVRKWRASKMRPKIYGDKLDLNVTQQVDVAGALQEGRARYVRPMSDQQNVIDAEVIEVKQVDKPSSADSESVAAPGVDIFT